MSQSREACQGGLCANVPSAGLAAFSYTAASFTSVSVALMIDLPRPGTARIAGSVLSEGPAAAFCFFLGPFAATLSRLTDWQRSPS
jgi:hypothetical protein